MADEAMPLPGSTSITTVDEWAAYFSAIATIGIVRGVGNEMAGSLNSGARTAVLGTGRAMMEGFLKPVTTATGTAIPAASAQDRVDRLVLRLDKAAATAADLIKPMVLTGTPGSSSAPTLALSSTLRDMTICKWTSRANGALEGLVDERTFIGDTGIHQFYSWARPGKSPTRLGIEIDTRRVMWADGTSWSYLGVEDSGEVPLPLGTGFVSAGSNTVRELNGTVYLDVNATWQPADGGEVIAEGNAGRRVATVPSGFRPSSRRAFSIVLSGDKYAQLHVQADGSVEVWHLSADVGSGTVFRAYLTYLP